MLQIFTEDSVKLCQIENTKTNNNIVGYHLVSRCVISTHPQVLSVRINAPKGPLYYPQNIMFQFQICCHSYLNVS